MKLPKPKSTCMTCPHPTVGLLGFSQHRCHCDPCCRDRSHLVGRVGTFADKRGVCVQVELLLKKREEDEADAAAVAARIAKEQAKTEVWRSDTCLVCVTSCMHVHVNVF